MQLTRIFTYISILAFSVAFAQDEEALKIAKEANNYVAEANDLIGGDKFVDAEMAYRKALSKSPKTNAGNYNLGHSYYKNGLFAEAIYRTTQAANSATTKAEKHSAFHNLGNVLMQNKQCKEAAEAFKNALRNDPTDNESRYNFALARDCAKQQEEENKNNKDEDEDSEDEEKKDENKDQKEDDKKDDQNKDDQKEDGDEDKKEGEDEKNDEGDPKDDKQDEGEKGENENKQPQPQQGQMSPQQIKNLLEDMENQEQKVQEKMNAQKAKGVKVQTDKDW